MNKTKTKKKHECYYEPYYKIHKNGKISDVVRKCKCGKKLPQGKDVLCWSLDNDGKWYQTSYNGGC